MRKHFSMIAWTQFRPVTTESKLEGSTGVRFSRGVQSFYD
jgi:hypothetical protein